MIGKGICHRSLLLALLLNLILVMALGCHGPRLMRKGKAEVPWVCPEFADLPLRQGLFEEAIEQHSKVLSQEPDNALAHYHLGYAYGQLGLHSDEIMQYQQAIDLGMERGDLF